MNLSPEVWSTTVYVVAVMALCGIMLGVSAMLGGKSGAIRIHETWIDEWLERAATPVEIRRA